MGDSRPWIPCRVESHGLDWLPKPSGPNLLDKPLKDFIVIPAGLPWKGVKRLATLGERVNLDSWVKMYDLYRVFIKLVY